MEQTRAWMDFLFHGANRRAACFRACQMLKALQMSSVSYKAMRPNEYVVLYMNNRALIWKGRYKSALSGNEGQ